VILKLSADIRTPGTSGGELKRYSAYFRGWCQAFGEHESIEVDEGRSYWLFDENQVGLVLPRAQIKPLNQEVLLHDQVPSLTFREQGVLIGSLQIPFDSWCAKRVLEAMEQLLFSASELHVFLTSHLLYGNGSRIITFSNKKPLSIIYKEIGNMHFMLSRD